jgi:hypothetical protein
VLPLPGAVKELGARNVDGGKLMELLAVVVSAAAGFGVGAVWYSVLAKPWMAAVGLTKEEVQSDRNPLPFIIAGLAALLSAGMMRHVFVTSGISGFGAGLVTGLGFGLFIAAPWVLIHYGFAGRPKSLWCIDCGHTIAAFTVMGAVLGLYL